MGETNLIIHANNCAGQNKNNAMIMYLAWWVAYELHTKITYSFMVASDINWGGAVGAVQITSELRIIIEIYICALCMPRIAQI